MTRRGIGVRCRRLLSSSSGAVEEDEDDTEAGLDVGSTVPALDVLAEFTSGNGDDVGEGGVLFVLVDELEVSCVVALVT